VINKIVTKYEEKIVHNYNVLVVSKTKLDRLNIDSILKIEQIDIQENLTHLKNQLKNLDFNQLQTSLPYFYRVYFKKFPTPNELKQLETILLSNPDITRVESFRTTQNQIYNLLSIIKVVVIVFMGIISIISILLIIKQLEVWRLEHRERMYIMELFGAPFGLRSAVLLKIAIIDSFLSVLVMFVVLEYIFNTNIYKQILYQLGIDITVDIFRDLGIFLAIALFISFISTMIVIFSRKDEIQ
jgi:cell division transport system permease protein